MSFGLPPRPGANLDDIHESFVTATIFAHDKEPSVVHQMVEANGIEPLTPCVQGRCSPS